MLRHCSKCDKNLDLSAFGVARQRKDGISYWCKKCNCESVRKNRSTVEGAKKHRNRENARYANHSTDKKQKSKEYYYANKDKITQESKVRSKNRRQCPIHRLWETTRQRIWYQKNPARGVAKVCARQTQKMRAMPNWLTAIQKAQIEEHYEIAVALNIQTCIKHHVDHIIPLRGKGVAGLHVPWNLQVITASENCSKGNSLVESYYR